MHSKYSKIKVVCFGGGTGLPALLSGLKDNPWFDITAVVTAFDDGGSSGMLVDSHGILPPGDIMKCLLALSTKNATLVREILLERIKNERSPGHTGGNALLLGLRHVYGSYLEAIDAFGNILSIRGSVVPVTLAQSRLCARYEDGSINCGETNVDAGVQEGKTVAELYLDPPVVASEEALEAIKAADVFCIGPGSFYTSVWPNFLPGGIVSALRAAKGKVIYIVNLLTEGKGMKDMCLDDIVARIERQIGRSVDCIVANDHLPSANEALLEQYATESKYPIISRPDCHDPRLILANLWLEKKIARHDSSRLANLVSPLISVVTEKISLPQTASPSPP